MRICILKKCIVESGLFLSLIADSIYDFTAYDVVKNKSYEQAESKEYSKNHNAQELALRLTCSFTSASDSNRLVSTGLLATE